VWADLKARLSSVGHDAHDAALAAGAEDDDGASEQVVAAEEHARRRVAEDDDGVRSFAVIVREIPAAPERDRQRLVIPGGDDLLAHGHVVVERLARRLEGADSHVDAERNAGRRRDEYLYVTTEMSRSVRKRLAADCSLRSIPCRDRDERSDAAVASDFPHARNPLSLIVGGVRVNT